MAMRAYIIPDAPTVGVGWVDRNEAIRAAV